MNKRHLFRQPFVIIFILSCMASLSLAQSPSSAIREWLVLGTFPSDSIDQALDIAFIKDEEQTMPEQGAIDPLSAYKWIKVQTPANGELDFLKLQLPHTQYCAVYAAAYIYSPSERNALLLVGSDDGVKLWLNDKMVHRHLVYRGLRRCEDKVPVRLAAGWNRLLAKVINGEGGFGLSVDVVDENGQPFTDVATTARKPENFAPIKLAVFPYIDRIELGTSYEKGGQRYFPIIVHLKNLGTSKRQKVGIDFIAHRMRAKHESLTLNDTTNVVIPLTAREMQIVMNKSIGIITYAGGKKCDDRVIHVSPQMVLHSLFASPNLPIQLVVLKTMYENLSENIHWYEKFSGKPFEMQDATLNQIVGYALNRRWDKFLKALEANFKEIKEFSTIIKQDTLHMIGQSHIDMAWLWRWPETVKVCQRTFQSAINFFEEYPDYKYIQSSAAAFQWMEEKYPELFEQIKEYVKQGRFFIVGGMWVEPDLNLIGGEALVRQFLYGKRYFREKFGVDCITGYTPDTFGYTWTLPQILKKFGFKYFVTTKIRWNDTTKFPYSLFKWVAPDGSEILTCFPMGLNVDNNPETLADHVLAFQKEGLSDVPELFGVGDHGGGPTRQHFEKIKKMQSIATYPTLYYNDLDSYMERVEKKYPNVPVYKDELYLEYHRGTLTTQGLIKKRNRKSEVALEEAEKFAIFSGTEYPKKDLEEAWKKTLFNQFHDILPGSSIPDVYIDANKDYDRVEELTSSIIKKSLTHITAAINLKGKHIPVVVFNPSSWQRTDWVQVTVPDRFTVKEIIGCDKSKVTFQQDGNRVLFMARDVPESGYKTFWLRKGKVKKQKNALKVTETTLENKFFKIEINPGNGNIRRFFDKRLNKDLLAPGQEGNILQFFEDKPKHYDAWNIGYTGKKWVCEKVQSIEIVESGPARAILRYVREFGKSKFAQDYTIYADVPRLDIHTIADWHEHHILAKAAFPVNVDSDSATFDIAYGSIRRTTHPKTPAEKAKFEVPAHKYIDLSQSDYGISLLNDCKYGHDVKDNVMRITLLRSPLTPNPLHRPAGYINPFADQGQHEFTYSIYPHAGDAKKALSVKRGYELNYPLIPIVASKHKGSLPQKHSFISLTPDNLVLTVVKKAEDSDAKVIRLYEVNGKEARGSIRFATPIHSAWQADMMEVREKELPVADNAVRISVKPYEIMTLIVE